MNIQMAKKLLADLQKLQQSISFVMYDLENIITASDEITHTKQKKTEIPEDDLLRNEWRKLQQNLKSQGNISNHINEFVKEKTKEYLHAFFKANDLPYSNKDPKDKIAQQLASLVHIGSTITGRV
ncbi:MAG: hypothetical protein AB2L22_11050 [Syntrophales bacterium]